MEGQSDAPPQYFPKVMIQYGWGFNAPSTQLSSYWPPNMLQTNSYILFFLVHWDL